jgi:hypothetical protein
LSYNANKAGVDSVDQMTRTYNVKSPCRRWPIQVFFNILNLSSINAWVLFRQSNASQISRRSFLVQLIEEICVLKNPSSASSRTAQASPTARRSSTDSPLSTLPPLPPNARNKRQLSTENSPSAKKRLVSTDDEALVSPKRSKCKIRQNCNSNPATYICQNCKLVVCGKCCHEIQVLATCLHCKT